MSEELKYQIGDVVYLITDPDQSERLVTAIHIYPQGLVSYRLSYGTTETYHYEMEIASERHIKKALGL